MLPLLQNQSFQVGNAPEPYMLTKVTFQRQITVVLLLKLLYFCLLSPANSSSTSDAHWHIDMGMHIQDSSGEEGLHVWAHCNRRECPSCPGTCGANSEATLWSLQCVWPSRAWQLDSANVGIFIMLNLLSQIVKKSE